jgi:pectin methylesterase-like acyl-CoA thioesterase
MGIALTLSVVLGLGAVVASPVNAATTIVVAQDGSGNFTSVQAAIDAVPGGGQSSLIEIKPGTYDETITLPANKPDVTIQGSSGNAQDVVIAAGHAAWMTRPDGTTYGTAGSATATIAADNVTVKDVTIANTYNPAAFPQGSAQAVAINAEGDRQVYLRDRFLGLQDTLLAWEPTPTSGFRQLFEDSFVQGNVDFLFGDSTAVFYRDAIQLADRGQPSGGNNGYLAAPATDRSRAYGFLIADSTVSSTAATNTFYLGRPWHPGGSTAADPQIVIRETVLPAQIKPVPWTTMSGFSFTAGRNAEYLNTGAGAGVNASRPQLTTSQAADYTPQKYLTGTDGWNPLG